LSKPDVEVQVRAVAAMNGGYAVFLGNAEKVFVLSVDQGVGAAIAMFMQGVPKPRPLTHDLLANVLAALGAKVQRLLVTECKGDTYFATLVLSAENELTEKKLIELDARPSDGIAMALQQSAPLYVSQEVWEGVEDMTEALRKLQERGLDPEGGPEQGGA
jgi:bifunctional DNase/RNase